MDTTNKKIWILDDDKSIRWVLQKALEKNNYHVMAFGNSNEAINQFNHDMPDLIVSDIKMPGESGLQFLEKVKGKFPNIPVIIMTAFSDLDSAVDSYAHGAYEYLPKPFDIDNAISVINSAFKDKADDQHDIENTNKIIGTSKVMQDVFKQIGKLSKSDASVLITGESGTGKELVAHNIHEKSNRSKAPFIEVNCAAIPSELIESELFGHLKGSFTSAVKDRQGKFEAANNGTLFLDEIGDMSLAAQAKVLRALEENKIQRVGSQKDISVDVRVVAATNKDLKKEIENGNFREDLYHRIAVIMIEVPELSKRKSDIPILISHFSKLISKEQGIETKDFNKDSIKLLEDYNWSGNIRELRNVIERLIILGGNPISKEDVNLFTSKK